MTGLIIKDLLNLKKQGKIYLLLVVFYFAMGLVNENTSMFTSMMTMVAVLIPLTAMAYDERSKWDRYALTMPISRKNMVMSRYLLGLIFLIVAFVLSMLVNMVISNMKTAENTLVVLGGFSTGLMLMSVIFPLLFKFGVEKGRIFMMIVIFIPVAALMMISKLGISMPDEEIIKSVIYLSPIIGAVIFLISIYVSLWIYKKKEF
ncbi:MAG: ABC-2 transporter permease [Tissierellia bacterium]|jgi:ABC-2 type transport system permease protein|nr:ABC-2 transporter permease [Tissierellia bacterium]